MIVFGKSASCLKPEQAKIAVNFHWESDAKFIRRVFSDSITLSHIKSAVEI